MKKILLLLSFLFCLVPFSVNANTIEVDSSLKVYDYAELLEENEESILYDKITKYIDKTNFDMVVVTISDNDKGSSANYADDFYDYNDFGLDDEYSGILYLIDMDNREVFISTTGDAIDVYNDLTIDSMLDEIYSDVSNENYYESCVTFIDNANKYFSEPFVEKKEINWPLSIIIALIVPSVVVWIMISSHKKIKLAITADDYVDRKATKIGIAKDKFLTKNVSRVYIQPSSSSGGSSTRIGSSGRSHGGGGRKF